jgi:hypothetical protein
MRLLSTAELLDIWEQGLSQMPAKRGLTLLAASCLELSPEKLAGLSIGQRDALLLILHKQTFGSRLVGMASCPHCTGSLEMNFSVDDILVNPEIKQVSDLSVVEEGYQVQFRLPNSLDIMTIVSQQDLDIAKGTLIKCCLLSASRNGEQKSFDQIPSDVIDAVVKKMAEADPQADVRLALSCPTCGHKWQEPFDIMSFFWDEINHWAKRLIHDVHILAVAYGWSEEKILALSPWRRQAYLDLVNQ